MFKLILLLWLLIQSASGQAQGKADIAISHFKKLWSESARPPTPTKIYFNKAEKLIDLGAGTEYQIPLSASILYVYDSIYKPAGHALVFSWETPNPNSSPLIPESKTTHKGFEVVFRTKDQCYELIDAIVAIRNAYAY